MQREQRSNTAAPVFHCYALVGSQSDDEERPMLKGEQTRRRILERAAPLFNKRGFNGCSMQDISAATGLEKGSLYTHFHNKEQLASEAFDTAWAQSSKARADKLDQAEGS